MTLYLTFSVNRKSIYDSLNGWWRMNGERKIVVHLLVNSFDSLYPTFLPPEVVSIFAHKGYNIALSTVPGELKKL